MSRLAAASWPGSRAPEALEALARAAGFAVRADSARVAPGAVAHDRAAFDVWVEQLGDWYGVEVEAVAAPYPEVPDMLCDCGPALIAVPADGGAAPALLAVVRGGERGLIAVGPDLRRHRLRVEEVRSLLCRDVEAPVVGECEALLEPLHASARAQRRARRALLEARLRFASVEGCWMVRLPAGAAVGVELDDLRLRRRLGWLVAVYAAQHALWILAWWAIGRGALQGRIESGWLAAWVILLLSVVPLRLLTLWWAGRLAIDAGALIKQRLMAGALRVDPDRLRSEGIGQLMGRVFESDAVEMMALSGGFAAIFSVIELALAAAVLAFGAGGALHVIALAGWLAFAFVLARRYVRQRGAWTEERLAMTHELVEAMVGHQTRLAQQRRDALHEDEDRALVRYVEQSRDMDRTAIAQMALLPRGWLLLGIAALVPAFLAGSGTAELAIALGGVLLAFRAFRQLAEGITELCGALISWRKVVPILSAASDAGDVAPPVDVRAAPASETVPAVRVKGVAFRHRGRPDPVLAQCDFEIRSGERVLLEGASGSGKSTLGALIAGVRRPDAGLIMVGGLDRHSLGAHGWRQRVVCAPQFHENHVFSAPVVFNVLMGRRWPPREADVVEAEALCRRLGLGEVLDRMPGGMLQLLGETGWQLSHGERSRLFIARALLQRAPVVVLDESLAALDPPSLLQVIDVVEDTAETAVVIAHP